MKILPPADNGYSGVPCMTNSFFVLIGSTFVFIAPVTENVTSALTIKSSKN